MSGLGLAVQLIRKFGVDSFEIIEKSNDFGGTWLANTYPGCGCDVASHFYSYSFTLHPDWSRKYSMRPEIQKYFYSIAEQYNILLHIQFHSTVEKAIWEEDTATWVVTIKDQKTKESKTRRCKILESAVGALSVPKECETPGALNFQGPLFYSARWDHSFDWKNKDVVVPGNGCPATQFVPIMSGGPNALTKSAPRHIVLPRDRTCITRLPSRWLCAIFPSPYVYTVLRFIGRWKETSLDLPLRWANYSGGSSQDKRGVCKTDGKLPAPIAHGHSARPKSSSGLPVA